MNATCFGETGAYACSCNSGFVGDGHTCTAVPPEINAFQSLPGIIGDTPGGVIKAAFQASQWVPMARVSVTVGGLPMSCTEAGAKPWIYTCTYSMTGQEIPAGTQSVQMLVASLSDTLGNTSSQSSFIDFDFRTPALTALTANNAGGTVTVSLSTDRQLSTQTPPLVSVMLPGGALALDSATMTAQSATLQALLPAGTAPGSYGLDLVLTDYLGNVSHLQPAMPVSFVQAGQ